MGYEYARMFISFEATEEERQKMSNTGESLVADGWKIHTFQITERGEHTLFERLVPEKVVEPEPMRIK